MAYPNWVLADVVTGLQDLVATLEAIAAANTLDGAKAAAFKTAVAAGPASSATVSAPTAAVTGLSNALVALYNVIPTLVSETSGIDPSVATGLFAIANGIAEAMAPASAVAVFAAEADATADAAAAPTQTANRLVDAENLQIVARLSRGVLLGAYAQALVLTTYADRPSAITARADCVERFEREIDQCQGAVDAPWAAGLIKTRDACVASLSQAIINAKPVMTVSAAISLPSLWWAYRLYGDPTRAADLIARNAAPHASFMPTRFEALTP
jgi:prophage DNA circulation protein